MADSPPVEELSAEGSYATAKVHDVLAAREVEVEHVVLPLNIVNVEGEVLSPSAVRGIASFSLLVKV